MRDEESIGTGERDREVVARDVCDRARLETRQSPDAMIDMNHVVPDAQVEEALDVATDHRPVRRRGTATSTKDRRRRHDREPELAGDHPGRNGQLHEADNARDGTVTLVAQNPRPEVGKLSGGPLHITAPLEADHDAPSSGRLAFQLGAALGKASGGKPGLAGIEVRRPTPDRKGNIKTRGRRNALGERLAVHERPSGRLVLESLGGGGKGRGVFVRSEPHEACSTETGIVERIDQVPSGRLDCRPDQRAIECANGALSEGRERPHRLDFVAESLDPDREIGGGREDVDDPTPHRQIAAALDLVDALIPEGDESVDEVPVHGLADPQRHRLEASLDADVTLGKGRDPGNDDPTVLTDRRDGASALPHNVRAGPNRAARKRPSGWQKCDGSASEEPAEGSGEIARLVVSGGHHDEWEVGSRDRGERPRPRRAAENETPSRAAGAKRLSGGRDGRGAQEDFGERRHRPTRPRPRRPRRDRAPRAEPGVARRARSRERSRSPHRSRSRARIRSFRRRE